MKEEKITRINVHNDEEMRRAGLIRQPLVEPRDETVWSKTDKERALLKKYKRREKRTK